MTKKKLITMRETIIPKPLFNKPKIDYRKLAVLKLADMLCGLIEFPLWLDGSIIVTPDVTCCRDGILDRIFEVVDDCPINGKKLGLIEYYCFRMGIELTVVEVSALYILSLPEKPLYIKTNEYYNINPFEFK